MKAMGTLAVPMLQEAEYPPTTPEQRAQIEVFKRKARMALSQEFPLAKDEVVQDEFYSPLKAPFLDLPPNTAALRRKTNQAVLYYFFDHVEVVEADLVLKQTRSPSTNGVEVRRTTVLLAEDPWSAGNLAKGLAGGLVNGVLGTIGALIFNSIFPPGVPSYFGEVYKEITRIFRQELATDEVNKINGRVNGVKQWVQNTYTPRKQQTGVSRRELSNMLTPMVDLLYTEAIGILMVEAYKKCGMSIFPMTASMHLALMQEQALVDPDEQDPLKSSYATTVKNNAKTYAEFLEGTFNQMRGERSGAVLFHEIPSEVVCTNTCHNSHPMWWVEDTVTGSKTGYYVNDSTHDHQREAALGQQNQWKTDALTKLTNELGDPSAVAGNFRVLLNAPIPKH